MKEPNHHADQEFDEQLREIGPDVPQPELDDAARARIMAAVADATPDPRSRTVERTAGRISRVATAVTALAAVLGVACVLLGVALGRARDQLATTRWENDEVLRLLVSARKTQTPIAPPRTLEGVTGSDLVVMTFHHDLCPIARHCTPGFVKLEQEHRGEPARFVTFDVTGAKCAEADREIDAMGIRLALLGPLGAETGVVKVIDMLHERVLSSAPGRQGLEQAETLLALVSHGERRP